MIDQMMPHDWYSMSGHGVIITLLGILLKRVRTIHIELNGHGKKERR